MLELKSVFDIQSEVVPWLLKGKLIPLNENGECTSLSRTDLQIVNVEKNGSVLFTWKGKKGTTCIGLHDLHKKQNKLLYTFDREVSLISCSVNMERTLLAVSILQFAGRGTFRPVSRCLTLLIEIHPVNNTKVLKAVNSNVKVQFLYQDSDSRLLPESHLLIISEDRYIEYIHIRMVIEEGYRVMVQNPDRLPREIVAEDFLWAQWDTEAQRLFYIVEKENNAVLMCIRFYPDRSNEMLISFSLGFSLTVTKLRLVNFGYNHFQEEEESSESLNLQVFSNHTGALSVCYSHPVQNNQEVIYSVILLHHGRRKTFRVSLEKSNCACISELTFLNIGYYVAVYVPGYFLHLINVQHPNLACHNLFLSGEDAKVKPWNHQRYMLSLSDSLLDCHLGKIYKAELNPVLLMMFMRSSKLGCHQLAVMHCAVLYLQNNSEVESQIIHWLCGLSASACSDLIQEFILGTLYRKAISETNAIAKLLPYSSLLNWKGEIPGITCTTENILQSVGKKVRHCKSFWEEVNRNVESLKNLESLHKALYTNSSLRRMQSKLFSEMKMDPRAIRHFRSVLENAKTILSKVDTWSPGQQVVPFFQEEDCQQMVLIGLMGEKLKEHLLKYVHSLGKKKIDVIVNNYVVNLLECIQTIVNTIWKHCGLNAHILCLSNREKVNSAEFVMFHMMTCVLQAVEGLSLPLPPGYHTIHIILGARCLPLHTLLHYIDLGVLHPTERFVTRLLEELDDSEINERFKFSIVARIPETIEQKICCLWDHPVSSSRVARNYVETLLKKLPTQQTSRISSVRELTPFESEFLPLTYLARILTEVEDQALNPFEEPENVDAKFVEEVALKQTLILLGLENN
ncbi:gamma-secretase-activating protein [Pristis pectinata]|uniref:gamma-secretase-activating protein n=1 Tax=Pristis pectinata TaxID=685728 RepID=UPI00223D5851|nr:gamma-secretase-activating protein [Pristis pectinata]XP_051890015.1 gamma-secretase-activating protein [Pristis pectinata]